MCHVKLSRMGGYSEMRWGQSNLVCLRLNFGAHSLHGKQIILLIHTKPYFTTEYGKAFLGDSSELMKEIPDDSINLVVTSPPFALTRKKAYGNKEDYEYVEWFMPFAKEIRRILKEDGSFVLDLGGAYRKGSPTRSLYQYELLIKLCNEGGFHLAQELFHYNPTRLPTPAEWVTVRRVRLKDSVNVVWWLSKSLNPKSDNRKVLLAYSDAMQDLLNRQSYNSGRRPSEHDINGTWVFGDLTRH